MLRRYQGRIKTPVKGYFTVREGVRVRINKRNMTQWNLVVGKLRWPIVQITQDVTSDQVWVVVEVEEDVPKTYQVRPSPLFPEDIEQ